MWVSTTWESNESGPGSLSPIARVGAGIVIAAPPEPRRPWCDRRGWKTASPESKVPETSSVSWRRRPGARASGPDSPAGDRVRDDSEQVCLARSRPRVQGQVGGAMQQRGAPVRRDVIGPPVDDDAPRRAGGVIQAIHLEDHRVPDGRSQLGPGICPKDHAVAVEGEVHGEDLGPTTNHDPEPAHFLAREQSQALGPIDDLEA